jgi:hypothetical protein
MKHDKPTANHYCNNPLRCISCVRRFWLWAENYSHRFERPLGKKKQAALDAARAVG